MCLLSIRSLFSQADSFPSRNSIGDKRKRASTLILRSAGITNSTINLTVIDPKQKKKRAAVAATTRQRRQPHKKSALKVKVAAVANTTATAAAIEQPPFNASSAHHNIHIDASTSGSAIGGGIQNSTININLHQARRRKTVELGDHSVLVDVSAKASGTTGGGIEDSTVHVNILPGRSLNKSVGEHSIVIDSSSSSSNEGTTVAGAHSAVVDTSATSETDSDEKTGIKGSTINLTVVAAKDSEEDKPAAISRRDAAWTKVINRKSYPVSKDDSAPQDDTEWDEVEVVVDQSLLDAATSAATEPQAEVFFEPKRSHYSKESRFARSVVNLTASSSA